MQLDLDEPDLEALNWALRSRLAELNRELARTDQHGLQHELAQLVSRLEVIAGRLELMRNPFPSEVASPR